VTIRVFVLLQRTPLVSRGCQKVSLTMEKPRPCRVCAAGLWAGGGLSAAQGGMWVPWGQQPQPLSHLHSDSGPSVGRLETLLCTAPQSTREGLGVAVVPLERGRGMVLSIPSIPRPWRPVLRAPEIPRIPQCPCSSATLIVTDFFLMSNLKTLSLAFCSPPWDTEGRP